MFGVGAPANQPRLVGCDKDLEEYSSYKLQILQKETFDFSLLVTVHIPL